MVGRKKRAPEIDANKIMPQPSLLSGPSDASGYEQSRDLRIKENKERMNKFGILHLSQKLKSEIAPRKRLSRHPSETRKTQTLPSSSGSPRRSSRLKTLDKVSYVELRPKRTKGSSESDEIRIRDGLNPEIYTEEHEKLLGDCKNTWTLLVDGYGEDGKRIYDEVNGETCHQCRQKTLGHHTHCSKCNLVQGQFCGDCLYSMEKTSLKPKRILAGFVLCVEISATAVYAARRKGGCLLVNSLERFSGWATNL
ncbi:uncharacterized protein LOC115705486 isoform X2 [Cannabis sativa]|uniref:uncharacterized protein LOC115705486 isoform X2 n=1 Tax=Cannabis sativa TaxID=3483 RepID=UPI0029CA4938|nr:uncharacterized protein LOC115705486 isoform X2 [Cannabis sativa]